MKIPHSSILRFLRRNYRSLSSLFLPSEKIYFYFFPPRSPALPCSILSSLALCVTPTQGLREMNGLIPVGKEWNITWCAHTCTTHTHTHADNEGHRNTLCGTVHMLKYTLRHTHACRGLDSSGKRRQINWGSGQLQSLSEWQRADETDRVSPHTHTHTHTQYIYTWDQWAECIISHCVWASASPWCQSTRACRSGYALTSTPEHHKTVCVGDMWVESWGTMGTMDISCPFMVALDTHNHHTPLHVISSSHIGLNGGQ